jgi:hypothetical protein
MIDIYFLLISISAVRNYQLYYCKMKNSKWVHLLHYEMTGLCKIEDELTTEIASWIKITRSPSLSVILQKVQLYAQEHSFQLGHFLKNKQISTVSSHQSVIRMLAREIQEKLKYCGSQTEKDHCILSNLSAISSLKNSFYESCLTMATRLNHQEAVSFFNIASANEARICQWTLESKKPQKKTTYNNYLLL